MHMENKLQDIQPISESKEDQPVSILTFNILAEVFTKQNAYQYSGSSKTYLKWDYRFELIQEQLIKSKSDIICLQEVDHPKQFISFFSKLNYKAVFIKRKHTKKDGCMIAFNKDKYNLISPMFECDYNTISKNILFKTNNIGMIIVLESIINNKKTNYCKHTYSLESK
eukprot:399438_1